MEDTVVKKEKKQVPNEAVVQAPKYEEIDLDSLMNLVEQESAKEEPSQKEMIVEAKPVENTKPPEQVTLQYTIPINKFGEMRKNYIKEGCTGPNDEENTCMGCNRKLGNEVVVTFKCGHRMHDRCRERTVIMNSVCCRCTNKTRNIFTTKSVNFANVVYIPNNNAKPSNKIQAIRALHYYAANDIFKIDLHPYAEKCTSAIREGKEPPTPEIFSRPQPLSSFSSIVKSIVPKITPPTEPVDEEARNEYSNEELLVDNVRNMMRREPKITCKEMNNHGITIQDIISSGVFIDEWIEFKYLPISLRFFTDNFEHLVYDLKFSAKHFNFVCDTENKIKNELRLFCDSFKIKGKPLTKEYVWVTLLHESWFNIRDSRLNGEVMQFFGFDIEWLLSNVPECCWAMFDHITPYGYMMMGVNANVFCTDLRIKKFAKLMKWTPNELKTYFGVEPVNISSLPYTEQSIKTNSAPVVTNLTSNSLKPTINFSSQQSPGKAKKPTQKPKQIKEPIYRPNIYMPQQTTQWDLEDEVKKYGLDKTNDEPFENSNAVNNKTNSRQNKQPAKEQFEQPQPVKEPVITYQNTRKPIVFQ